MKRVIFLLAAACMLLASCSSNINMFLPRGPEGGDGKSAYELWLESVAAGIDNPHTAAKDEWPKNETDIHDFYRFLSGRDGLDGEDGKDGKDGGSGSGSGGKGDDGAPGKSAWELWVEDVTDADGLDNPHTPAPGDTWPDTEISLEDFWRYLSADGEQSHNTIVEPGKPGIDFNPVIGKPNVIAVYQDQLHSEYVNPETGTVTYQVYKADGTKAGSNVEVSGLPGIAGKSYTTIADGTFTVPAADLPTTGDVPDRYDSVDVDGTPSATNTYVPQKITTRLVVGTASAPVPTLITTTTNELSGGIYMSIPVKAQRKVTSEGEWQDLPAYMTGITREIHAYGIKNGTMSDPDLAQKMPLQRSDGPFDLTGAGVAVRRPTFQTDWMTDVQQKAGYYLQDSTVPELFTMYMDDGTPFYGQHPHTTTEVIWTLPVNFHPLPKNLVMNDFSTGGAFGTLLWVSGSFNVDMYDPDNVFDEGNIVEAYRYVSKYVKGAPIDGVSAWERGNDASDNDCLGLMFVDGGSEIGDSNLASLGDPDFTFNQRVNVGSMVYLSSTSLLIAGPGNGTPIGQLISNPDWTGDPLTQAGQIIGGETQYIIRARAPFTFPDIPIYSNASQIP